MKTSKLWNIGLSLFLMAAAIAGCSSDSASSDSYNASDSASSPSSTAPDSSGDSSDGAEATNSAEEVTQSASNHLDREDGVFIQLYGDASFRSNDGDGTIIDIREGGHVLYFSYRDGPKSPIVVVGENAEITVNPSEGSVVSQNPAQAIYTSRHWQTPRVTYVSASADLIATGTNAPGYIFYANSQLHYTTQVNVVASTGAVIAIADEVSPSVVAKIGEFATELNTRQAAKTGAEAAEEATPVLKKAMSSIRLCGSGRFRLPCLK